MKNKILIIAPTPFFSHRGTHIRIFEQAKALEKKNYSITINTYHIGTNPNNYINTNIKINRISPLLFWYKKTEAGPHWIKIILDFQLLFSTLITALKLKPTIIHAHLHEGVLIGWLIKKILFWRSIKLISDLHGSLSEEISDHNFIKSKKILLKIEFIEKIINNLGDKVIVSSLQNNKRFKKNPTIINDGYSLKSTIKNKRSIKISLNLPANKKIITYTGGFYKNKGIKDLIKAIPSIINEKPNTHFIFAGNGSNKIKNLLRNTGLNEFITYIDPLNYFYLHNILHVSDIAVDPKNFESNQGSGKIYSYLAAKLPIVCYKRQQYVNLLGNNYPFVKESIAKTIIQFLDTNFSPNYPEESFKKYHWDTLIENLIKIYHE